MRGTVHKPEKSLKPAIKPQAPAEVVASIPTFTPNRSVASVDPARLARAQHTAKHAAVRRFSGGNAADAPSFSLNGHTPTHVQTHVPVIAVRPAPALHAPATKQHVDIFEAAIAGATGHTQSPHRLHRSRRRKLTNIAAGMGAVLVIGGFIAFLNVPNIELNVASIHAGFHATMPSYAPTGYALAGGVQRTGDTVSMVFRSGTNNYTLTQQPSDWDNETLLENTLPLQSDHQTMQVAGRTVFLYGGKNAVWVTGNIRYDLRGNIPLDTADISHLAMSL